MLCCGRSRQTFSSRKLQHRQSLSHLSLERALSSLCTFFCISIDAACADRALTPAGRIKKSATFRRSGPWVAALPRRPPSLQRSSRFFHEGVVKIRSELSVSRKRETWNLASAITSIRLYVLAKARLSRIRNAQPLPFLDRPQQISVEKTVDISA